MYSMDSRYEDRSRPICAFVECKFEGKAILDFIGISRGFEEQVRKEARMK